MVVGGKDVSSESDVLKVHSVEGEEDLVVVDVDGVVDGLGDLDGVSLVLVVVDDGLQGNDGSVHDGVLGFLSVVHVDSSGDLNHDFLSGLSEGRGDGIDEGIVEVLGEFLEVGDDTDKRHGKGRFSNLGN